MIGSRQLRLLTSAIMLACVAIAVVAPTGNGAAGTTSVPVNVPPATHLTVGCGPSILLPMLMRGGTSVTTSNCDISFGASNSSSARLRATDSSDLWGMQSSGGAQIPDTSAAGGMLTSGFGMCLNSVGAGATSDSMTTSPCTAASSGWYALKQSTSRTVAQSTIAGTATAGVRFGVVASTLTPPGTYSNSVVFEVVSP